MCRWFKNYLYNQPKTDRITIGQGQERNGKDCATMKTRQSLTFSQETPRLLYRPLQYAEKRP